jgi:hypothetical protein
MSRPWFIAFIKDARLNHAARRICLKIYEHPLGRRIARNHRMYMIGSNMNGMNRPASMLGHLANRRVYNRPLSYIQFERRLAKSAVLRFFAVGMRIDHGRSVDVVEAIHRSFVATLKPRAVGMKRDEVRKR